MEQNGDLKLVVEGEVFRPEDELRGVRLEVGIAEPQKVGTGPAVEKWSRAVQQTVDAAQIFKNEDWMNQKNPKAEKVK